MAPSLLAQDLARIHYAVRVERALHGAHERELDRGGVALELRHLGPTHPVLGAEAAAELVYQLVHGAPHAVGATEKALAVTACRLTDVEMQVAVAHVAVRHQPAIGNVGADPGRGPGDKIREHRDGNRNVVFEAGALVALCLGDALAQLPQRSALALAARSEEHTSELQSLAYLVCRL